MINQERIPQVNINFQKATVFLDFDGKRLIWIEPGKPRVLSYQDLTILDSEPVRLSKITTVSEQFNFAKFFEDKIIVVQGNRRVLMMNLEGEIENEIYSHSSDIMAFGIAQLTQGWTFASVDYYGTIKIHSLEKELFTTQI